MFPDLFRPLLRSGEPLQEAPHLHREDHRGLQGQEEARGPAPRLRHHRHCLQVIIISCLFVARTTDDLVSLFGKTLVVKMKLKFAELSQFAFRPFVHKWMSKNSCVVRATRDSPVFLTHIEFWQAIFGGSPFQVGFSAEKKSTKVVIVISFSVHGLSSLGPAALVDQNIASYRIWTHICCL